MNPLALSVSSLLRSYAVGDFSPTKLIGEIFQRIEARGNDAVWIDRLTCEQALGMAREVEARRQRGESLPLYGIPFAIKDNIDWAGHPTTAACPAFAYTPERSATAVQKLIAAGAIPLGKTNLDQFATGLVGVRSPYGAPRSIFHADYISGGSSSGSAVAVAAGLAAFSLGTDTAGSGRVPAAFNNLVGLKPTKGRISAAGVVPACRSLDCVSIFTNDAEDARLILRIIEGQDTADAWSRRVPKLTPAWPKSGFRFGVPRAHQLEFFGDRAAQELFAQALSRLEKNGGRPVEIDYQPFRETALLLYAGPWVAERMAGIQDFYRTHAEEMHPVVRRIVSGADQFNAVDVFRALYRLQELKRQVEPVWSEIDFLVLPTTGTIYTVAQVEADPVALNSNLGYYTNFVNLLDLSGIAVPAGFRANGLPFGVTFLAPAFADESLCSLAKDFMENTARKG